QVTGLGGAFNSLGDAAQAGGADHTRSALQPVRGAVDDREIIAVVDLTLGDARRIHELPLDLGQHRGIVAEQFDQAIAVVGLAHGTPFSQPSSVALSCSMPIGLVMKPSMPADRLFCSCSSRVLAVTARMGVRSRPSAASLARMHRASSKPSMPGICKSARTR